MNNDQMIKEIVLLIGLASLIAFTAVTTALAVLSGGAMVYFYEPNKTILILEVFLGIYGVGTAVYLMKEIISSKG